MKMQKGFTLIELVIVVVILGFLAITALPKFIDLTDQAKKANVEGMSGGFATGVSLIRSQWEAEARPNNGTQNIVDYDGTTVYLTVEDATTRPGYILGTTVASAASDVNCTEVWNAILQQPPTITESDLDIDSNMNYYASKNGNICHYYLRASLLRDGNATKYKDPANSTAEGNSFTYDPTNSEVIVYINN